MVYALHCHTRACYKNEVLRLASREVLKMTAFGEREGRDFFFPSALTFLSDKE